MPVSALAAKLQVAIKNGSSRAIRQLLWADFKFTSPVLVIGVILS
jgi:hypothetical protein